jgi:hypothetical protein
MRLLRRILLVVVLGLATLWLGASAGLAMLLPTGWAVTQWPLSVPGLAALSPEGALVRWTPWEWRVLRVTGNNITPRGSRLGPITTLDAELEGQGSLPFAEGPLAIRGLSVVWGPLRFSGTGALERDDLGGLQGMVRGRMEGHAELTSLLSRAGVPAIASGRDVQLPVSLRDGQLTVAFVPVLSLR